MATVTIKGIRLNTVTLNLKDEEGEGKLSANYSLISSTEKVLATQSIGGYDGLKIQPSPATVKALDAFLAAYKADINTALGLE